MPKTGLEKAIDVAVAEFTEIVVDAVRDLPLDELSDLRGEDLVVRPEVVENSEPEREPEPERTRESKAMPKATVAKKTLKCAFPGCERNRFVRGRGYCGKHWKKWKRGEID